MSGCDSQLPRITSSGLYDTYQCARQSSEKTFFQCLWSLPYLRIVWESSRDAICQVRRIFPVRRSYLPLLFVTPLQCKLSHPISYHVSSSPLVSMRMRRRNFS